MLLATAPPWRIPLRSGAPYGTRVASGRDMADLSGLPLALVDSVTQTQARAHSTSRAYALKWSLLVGWCSSHQKDRHKCPISYVLSFLQERLE